jgi:radical SAM protein with 4Fe4S-binding SPASM domain
LRQVGLHRSVVLFACLTRDNVGRLEDFIRLAERLEVKALKFSQWQKQGRASKTSWADKSPSLEDWIRCGHTLENLPHSSVIVLGNFWGDLKNDGPLGFSLAGRLFPKFFCHLRIAPRIDCQGNVWPCQLFVDGQFAVGNIKEKPLESVLNGDRYGRLFSDCSARVDTVAECKGCEWKAFCGGGCPAFAYAERETLHARDFFCNVRKYWFDQFVQRRTERVSHVALPPGA